MKGHNLLGWGETLSEIDVAHARYTGDERPREVLPTELEVNRRFGLDLRADRQLHAFIRALSMQARASSRSAVGLHLVQEFEMSPEAAKRLAFRVIQAWYGYLLEVERFELLPLLVQMRISVNVRPQSQPPNPNRLRWPSVAPTAEMRARHQALLDASPSENTAAEQAHADQQQAQLSRTYSDGLVAYANMVAATLIVETATRRLGPGDGVSALAAERFRDMVVITNFNHLPTRWRQLCRSPLDG